MVIIYFETRAHAEVMGVLNTDELYGDVHASFEAYAKKNGGWITESVVDNDLTKVLESTEA